jgi:transcriptional regulator with XRE-family HTH domain
MSKEYRTIPAAEVLAQFSSERLDKINARALQLIAEEVGLTELRKARRLTQQDVAAKLGGKQAHVSRLEKRTDVKVSSLSEYVNALGADLSLLVTFPEGALYKLDLRPDLRRRGLKSKGLVAKASKPSKKTRRPRLGAAE